MKNHSKFNPQKSPQPEKLYSQQEVDAIKSKMEEQFVDRKKQDKHLVAGLVRKSNRILATIRTHKFPVDFFPNTLNIEEGRITVVVRNFFFSSQMFSIDIENITNIFINTSPFFAQLIIVSNTFINNEIRITNLWQKDAIFARRIIEGLRTFINEEIDTSHYTKAELIAKLEQLSTTEIVT